jgi:hypothetical protein
MRQQSPSRRDVVCAALSSVVAAVAGVETGHASDKMTREQAQYQDQPKGISMCATCTLFEPPKSCKVVEGDVSPEGWCKAFALAD